MSHDNIIIVLALVNITDIVPMLRSYWTDLATTWLNPVQSSFRIGTISVILTAASTIIYNYSIKKISYGLDRFKMYQTYI